MVRHGAVHQQRSILQRRTVGCGGGHLQREWLRQRNGVRRAPMQHAATRQRQRSIAGSGQRARRIATRVRALDFLHAGRLGGRRGILRPALAQGEGALPRAITAEALQAMVAIVDHPHRPLTAASQSPGQPQRTVFRGLHAIEPRCVVARGHDRANHLARAIHTQQRVAVGIADDETIVRGDHPTRITRHFSKRHEGGIAVAAHLDAIFPEQQQRPVGIHRGRAKRPRR